MEIITPIFQYFGALLENQATYQHEPAEELLLDSSLWSISSRI